MQTAPSRKPTIWWLALAIVLLLVAGGAPYIRQVCLAAAIQNSVEISDEITLNDGWSEPVPEVIESAIHKSVDWYRSLTHASLQECKLYRERLRMPFQAGQLRNLEIYDPKNFDERLCKVIRKCRSLQSVTVCDWGGWGSPPTPPESSWRSCAKLCAPFLDWKPWESAARNSPTMPSRLSRAIPCCAGLPWNACQSASLRMRHAPLPACQT
jgi:hypothetical protein